MRIYRYVDVVECSKSRLRYELKQPIMYKSERYEKLVIGDKGELFDGATGALDIDSLGWIVHDILCRDGHWQDGTPCTNWQASTVLSDILKDEGRWFRARSWFVATWLFGGGKARDNGML